MIRRTYQLDDEPNPPVANPPTNGIPPQTDLAGYPNLEALVQGYRNSSQEAQRLNQRVQQVEQAMAQMQQPRQNAAPEERLSDLGIPVDALDQVINARLQRAFEPIAKGIAARSTVVAQYPDYGKFESDVNQYIQADPQLQQTYNNMLLVDPAAAFEYGYLKYGENKRRTTPSPNEGNKRDKVNAQIPTGSGSDTRSQQDAGGDVMNRAMEHYKKTGDPVPAFKTKMRQVIPDSFFEK